ncbi:hypothetical protein TVAG_182040 [Trichomonas vaginalis G3]|uniref:Uncharacterized protein n=1 Tax=Trichomonas vaginalis (strain ATCC PRA-98 / G3) TaxID=412133 RepID=A2F6Y6_TRIV3|nr:hypothetical protein TVAGG3_0007280 [Trichomonas vaginalis G3]EAX99347.1 hypothetical protein TVAG_182040 [Trichomonas vaginalis G3]KAI5538965.1 hypothetical protein TVAGG3_0007280 [Trichomonas vaginalis G3]|eukprot:XP_001312277.1 hypothetical protein [Trichomonas vaginalis G3]
MFGKLEVKLIPRKNSDGNRIKKKNGNPLQRLNVESSAHLHDIARYIYNLAFQKEDPHFEIGLYLSSNGVESKLPLTLTVGEFAFITHQTNSVEIKYSYNKVHIDEPPRPVPPPPPPQSKITQQDIIAQLQPTFLPPLPSQHPIPEVNETKALDSVMKPQEYNPPSIRFGEGMSNILFSTGLTLWNDSFGPVPMEKKNSNPSTGEKNSTPESECLKNQLESLMQQGKH